MLKTKLVIPFVSILMFVSLQNVMADEALAKSSNCLACHSVDNKIIGPAFKDIAAKYKGDDGAAAMLAGKVKNGGGGTWGQMPMPPNAAVSDADIATLVSWILSL
jgi:cytochrome c551/c552